MKKITLLILCFLQIIIIYAQTPPNAFNYSAVARNASGQPIANSTIGIQISILKTSTVGTTVYKENHSVNTDAFGLFNLIIGAGAIQTGSMAGINWSNDSYYIKVGMDASGGTNFLTMGTTQLLSVPYALYAKNAGSISNNVDNDTSATNELQVLSKSNDTLFLTNGGFVKLPKDNDTSTTNELQTLTISNDTIFLSNGGFVKLPSNAPSSFVAANITTKAVLGITPNSATFGGIVSNATNNQIIERGIVYDTISNPTVNSDRIYVGKGIGSYDTITSRYEYYEHILKPNTKYYVRAYAYTENNIVLYGNEVNFTTAVYTPPTISTNTAYNITSNQARIGYTISATNGNTIISKGLAFSKFPLIIGSIPQNIHYEMVNSNELTSGLHEPNTTYYARAYVKTENGIVTYGNQITFTTLSVGQTGPGGGIVFYNKGNSIGGWQYLECASSDQSTGIQWGCSGTLIGTNYSDNKSILDSNTNLIVSGCNDASFAAKLCYNLTLGGKSDWYLPNSFEFQLMEKNLYQNNLGNFSYSNYWTSIEIDSTEAVFYEMGGMNGIVNPNKTSNYRVRAVRAY